MSANAPYYQVRASQLINTTDSTNAIHSPIPPQEANYTLPAPTAIASTDQQVKTPVSIKPTAHQNPVDQPIEDSHIFSGLLEAASSVASEQAMQADTVSPGVEVDVTAHGGGQKKRASCFPVGDVAVEEDAMSSKRRRVHVPTDPQLQEVDRSMSSSCDNSSGPQSSESPVIGSRTVGVHSAAALFRRSSERTSRKYTRPPMSKLFMSLQLSPEDFLQLQAQAKAYMLDTRHPERQNCVGNRGKGDTDMVKLRLFNCVRDFLNEEAGEQFFGEHVDKPGEREALEAARALGEESGSGMEGRLTWPRDGNKIISLVTPLMRRMVTNERQRQYAIETRRGGSKKGKEEILEASTPRAIAGQDGKQQTQSPLDPKLAQQAPSSRPTSPLVQDRDAFSPSHGHLNSMTNASISNFVPLPSICPAEPNLSHINIFLTLASSEGKPSVKLDEKRIFVDRPAHLTFYNWSDFVKDVHELLCNAQSRHAGLRRRPVLDENMGPNSLRGLAAAANLLQSEIASPSYVGPDPSSIAIRQETTTSPSALLASSREDPLLAMPSAAEPGATAASRASSASSKANPAQGIVAMSHIDEHESSTAVPRHVIKTIGASGWSIIDTEQDWYHVLREKAFAVWADGVCNVLVELIDATLDDLSTS